MEITRYKEVYNLKPNFIAYRGCLDYIFIQECFSKPNPKLYNIGVWIIKYKNNE